MIEDWMDELEEITPNMTNSSFENEKPYVCPYCKREVPKKEIELWGTSRIIQPSCECEIKVREEEEERERQRQWFKERQRDYDQIFSYGQRLKEATFENFIMRPGAEVTFEKAKDYAENFNSSVVESLLLCGSYGSGKTHLAAAIANTLKNQDKATFIFTSVPALLEQIRATFRKNNESEERIMRALLHCELLVLDDIAAEKPSDWTFDVLFRIIDGRYLKKAPIMYTSNLMLSELAERLGGRIYDRIIDTSTPILNKATSFREERAKERWSEMKGRGGQ